MASSVLMVVTVLPLVTPEIVDGDDDVEDLVGDDLVTSRMASAMGSYASGILATVEAL